MSNALINFISKYVTLTKEEEQTLLSLDAFRTLKKGTVLLSEGETTNQGYFVLNGCIRTFYNKDGEEKTTAFYTEMEGHTPASVVTKKPSEYAISCVEDCVLTVSTPDMEEEMFAKFPKFEKLCRILGEELLTKTQISFDDFKTSSPEERYLSLLENRPELIQRVPQHQLASFLGIAPQSLSRLKSRISLKKA